MFWYQQPPRESLKLLVSTSTWAQNSYEEGYSEARFKVSRENDYFVMTIVNVTSKDEATYFCAVRDC
ncbi:TVB29 protein, partial [Ramphastos sulfuratus]|nr:TVB29 protein [Ramphastos sulfuratus]